ncbi:methyl-CpG-binding domain-containing protein 2-like [Punica granatum]|uniref:Uncharacterized protein n=2 Tax=Punica granatum TaxID=22663 RepID=A0A218XW10_PUNGR|nr:methyl-CpG-binding domain-containing protein 2-like [Punica granatum]OWM89247.1 hypothetical protein CDL15_Pgr010534 [Punica granatum]PKI59874.1 hypothetical protein CRG98_019756 [Punica granatum]
MQSSPGKPTLKLIVKFKKKEKEQESSLPDSSDDINQEPTDTSTSIRDRESCENKECCDESNEKPLGQQVDDESKENTSEQPVDYESNEKTSRQSADDESNEKNLKESVTDESNGKTSKQPVDDESNDDYSKQLVVYDPLINGGGQIVPVPDPSESQHSPFVRHCANQPPKVLPSVGAFTVQCANCFKWRLIPTKEKYEEIRERILQVPFFCETVREWRPDISCDDPEDISQDGSRLWAIDKPNIAQPPPGWQRLLRIRGEGGTKFADVYYVSPSGKRLRSMVEIQKYLMEHPEYVANGVTMSQFSFQIPRPLQENYVRKRPSRGHVSYDGRPLDAGEARPLAWAAPEDLTELQLGMPGLSSSSSFGSSSLDQFPMPKKKKKKKPKNPLREQMYSSNEPYHQHNFGLGEPGQF